MIEEMSKTETNVVFLKVDVDVNEEGAEAYNVTAMPTFVFLQNGVKVSQCHNTVCKSQLYLKTIHKSH